MFESITEVVRSAEALIEEGDQGDAQALLTQSLLSCRPAADEAEAIAIAEATKLVIDLDAGLLPGDLLEVRFSVFSLAECHTRLGEHSAAAQAYEWVRLHPHIGVTKADFRLAAQAKKAAERESRRTKKTRS